MIIKIDPFKNNIGASITCDLKNIKADEIEEDFSVGSKKERYNKTKGFSAVLGYEMVGEVEEPTWDLTKNKDRGDNLGESVLLEIRKKLRELINLGFHDAYRYIHPDKEGYTFWDYTSGAWQKNNGMRIDHFLVSNSLIKNVKDVKINKFPRGRQKPSDHTPIEIELA